MKTNMTFAYMLTALLISGSFAFTAIANDDETGSWYEKKLSIGARIHYFSLDDTRRSVNGRYSNKNVKGNFIGSVWGLDENQEYVPRLHVNYAISQYGGLGISYDQIGAETVDWGNLEGTVYGSDGNLNVWGPMIYLFGAYPNKSSFTPFAELGYVQYYARFDESTGWAATAPGYRFEVDDSTGHFLAFGVDYAVAKTWHVDFYYRLMNADDVDARAYFTPGPLVGRYGAFPLDYDMFAVGTSFAF